MKEKSLVAGQNAYLYELIYYAKRITYNRYKVKCSTLIANNEVIFEDGIGNWKNTPGVPQILTVPIPRAYAAGVFFLSLSKSKHIKQDLQKLLLEHIQSLKVKSNQHFNEAISLIEDAKQWNEKQ